MSLVFSLITYAVFMLLFAWFTNRVYQGKFSRTRPPKRIIKSQDQQKGDSQDDNDDGVGRVEYDNDPDLDLPPGVTLPKDEPELMEA